ncbi:alpha/beta fold hydrolase [Methylibium sp.]|uniref:alpha/beta fold hydrolase n=1 Tax=Methylibium sp. TaxID=2067992 RepID=UPI0025FAF3EC|nr:alpha/beta fold hydrolase [Methylibium sp.]
MCTASTAAAMVLPAASLAQDADPSHAPAPCRVDGLRHEVLCGRVSRPLDPAQPAGRRIDVHYVVVPATALAKRPDPVFFFAGGPGQSAIALAGRVMPLFQRLNNRRDIVFIDQRGTGRSAPLTCASDDALPLAERLDPDRAIARLHACRETLQALPHGDLRRYTTVIATTDAEAVRAALGAPQVNLVGGSYGSRAALDYLRQFPARVRRVVLDGVAPPDMALPRSLSLDTAAALEALFADCARDAACTARHPKLRERWQTLLASLPARMSAVDPATGITSTVTLRRETVAAAVRGPLYAPALAAALPFAINEALAGRAAPLIGLAGSLGGGTRALETAEGMHFSVVCAEDMPRLDAPPATGTRSGATADAAADETVWNRTDAAAPAQAANAFSQAFLRPYREVCADWPRSEVPPAFYTLPRSTVPLLAFSGTLDPVTPPRHGERVVRALGAVESGGKARHVVVANVGHGVFAVDCTREVLQRFIDVESEADAMSADASCLAGLPRPPAFEPPRPELAG